MHTAKGNHYPATVNVRNGNQYKIPMHITSKSYNYIIKLLIDNGADVNQKNTTAQISIMYAAEKCCCEAVRILIDNGADVNAIPYTGTTVLLSLIVGQKSENIQTIKMLIDNGADVNVKNIMGQTAIKHAAKKGFIQTIKMLIDNGADVNVKDISSKQTPLMCAAVNGQCEAIEVLVENGADVNAKDENGWTAAEHANSKNYYTIVSLLNRYTAGNNTQSVNNQPVITLAAEKDHDKTIDLDMHQTTLTPPQAQAKHLVQKLIFTTTDNTSQITHKSIIKKDHSEHANCIGSVIQGARSVLALAQPHPTVELG